MSEAKPEARKEVLTPQKRQAIADELVKRNALLPCPRCGHPKFSIEDGYFIQVAQSNFDVIELAGTVIPTAMVTCLNCGFVSQHALGVLGLLPKEEGK